MNTIKEINVKIDEVHTSLEIENAYRNSLFQWDVKNQIISCVKGTVAKEIVLYYASDEIEEDIKWITIEMNPPLYIKDLDIEIPDLPKFDPKRYYSFMIKNDLIIPVKIKNKKLRKFKENNILLEN